MTDRFLTRLEAADYLHLSHHTVNGYIRDGRFPEPDLRAGSHTTATKLWLASTLDAWDDSRRKIPGPVPKDHAA